MFKDNTVSKNLLKLAFPDKFQQIYDALVHSKKLEVSDIAFFILSTFDDQQINIMLYPHEYPIIHAKNITVLKADKEANAKLAYDARREMLSQELRPLPMYESNPTVKRYLQGELLTARLPWFKMKQAADLERELRDNGVFNDAIYSKHIAEDLQESVTDIVSCAILRRIEDEYIDKPRLVKLLQTIQRNSGFSTAVSELRVWMRGTDLIDFVHPDGLVKEKLPWLLNQSVTEWRALPAYVAYFARFEKTVGKRKRRE